MDPITEKNDCKKVLQMTLKQLQDFHQANKEIEQNNDEFLKQLNEANLNKEELLLELMNCRRKLVESENELKTFRRRFLIQSSREDYNYSEQRILITHQNNTIKKLEKENENLKNGNKNLIDVMNYGVKLMEEMIYSQKKLKDIVYEDNDTETTSLTVN